MFHLFKTTALISLIATPTLADVNARNVWDMFIANYNAVGLQIEATEISDGDTLKLENIKISGKFPFESGDISISATGISLIGNSDGTVTVQFPETMPLAVALSLPDDLFITATLDYNHKGHKMTASGDPDKVLLNYSADLVELTLTDATSPADTSIKAAGLMSLSGITGLTTLQTGEMFTISQEYSADELIMDWDYSISGSGAIASKSRLVMQEMAGDNILLVPNNGFDFKNLAAQFRNGASLQTTYSSGTYIAKAESSVNSVSVIKQDISVGSTDSTMSLTKDGFKMKVLAENYLLDFKVNDLPFAIRGKIDNLFADFVFPLLSGEKEQGFVYNIALNNFTMDPEIWAQFDPKNILPRDPADLIVKISGKAKLFFDLLDFETMQKVAKENTKFGEITSVTIDDFILSAVNTKLSAKGAFTLDNTDLTTFGGFPAPDGNLLVNLSGMDAMIKNLVKMGLVSEDDVMGMRMGLMMMAVAGEKEDTLVSDIKVSPNGEVTANGKRIK